MKLRPSIVIRRVHLFTGLFLAPWILMYAVSTFVMHHRDWFTGEHRRVDPGYELVKEEAYAPEFAEGIDRNAAANVILDELGLQGAHSVRGDAAGTLTIDRHRPIGSQRITYDAGAGQLRIEKQRFAAAYFLEMLHRRRGYDQPFAANDAWAFLVDVVIVTLVLWAVTGALMWWEMAKTRKVGAICALGGVGLFILLFTQL